MKSIHILLKESPKPKIVFITLTGKTTIKRILILGIKRKRYISNKIDKEIKKFCNSKKKGVREYKEIFTFSYEKNVEKMLDYIQYGPIYSCRYFENKDVKTRFPKL